MDAPRLNNLGGEEQALASILQALRARDYHFVTATPLTHARVIANRAGAGDLRDVFGWTLPFEEALIEPELFALMRTAGVLDRRGEHWISTLRASSLGGLLFLHSAYPTLAHDAVFFGPDTYRFAAFLKSMIHDTPNRIADIGAGAGAGGIVAAQLAPSAEVVLTDVNPQALRLAKINAAVANMVVHCVQTNALDGVLGDFDLIVANPPYIIDDADRAYRHGGDLFGGQVALDWTKALLPRLSSGGQFLLYTGCAIVNGANVIEAQLRDAAQGAGYALALHELDPDVFGEELERDAYRGVERIAVIGAAFRRP